MKALAERANGHFNFNANAGLGYYFRESLVYYLRYQHSEIVETLLWTSHYIFLATRVRVSVNDKQAVTLL